MKELTFLKELLHYLYFLNKDFKFQPNICNRCHDLLMMSIDLSDISVLKTLKVLIITVLLAELAKIHYLI